MSKFQLYIGSQRVELFKDESVSLTETIQDIKDVSKVFTDFTKPFTLPASDTNNKIFKHYYKFNIAQGFTFDARKKVSAKIELNTVPYKDGKIRLEGVDLENGKPKSYRITFFGNTVNLKDILGDDLINGLSWLSNFNLTYSANKIEEVMTTSTGYSPTIGGVQYNKAIIVPLISNTQRLYYSTTNRIPYNNADGTINSALGGNLYPTDNGSGTKTTDDIHGVLFEDLTYAIQIDLIVKAIEEEYTDIKFSDDFFNLTNGPDSYKKLYMLCQKKEGRPFEDMSVGERLITGFSTGINNNIVTSFAGISVFGLNPSQFITAKWTLTTGQAHPTFTAVLREGSEEVLRRKFIGGTSSTAIITQFLTNSEQGYNLTIETESAFDITSVLFEGSTPSGNTLSSQINTTIAVEVQKEFVVQQHLPNMKVVDFLTSLFKMYNLTAFELDGIIHVKTLESFYSSGSLRDITEFVDPQTLQIDKALPYREIEFKYDDTETTLAKQHFESNGVRWGAAKYIETGNLNSNDQKFDVVSNFAHLKYERIVSSIGSNTDIQWGFLANEKNEPFFQNAVVFIGDFVTLPTGNTLRFLSGTTSVGEIHDVTEYWMPSNTVERDSTVSKESIHFSVELSEWDSTASFTDTLFNKYHRFYIAGLFNSAKRLSKIKARLPKKFMLNYTLADTVIINQDRYKINSITTDLLSGSSQLELLNETINDATITQDDTGGEGGQTGAALTNVLTLFQCVAPNSTFESTLTLADLNLAVNIRVEDAAGNTYRVTGNNVPNTHTTKAVTSTGETGCPSGTTPPPTNYYGLRRCSDGATNLRTSTAVGSPSYQTTQQVFDSSSVKYVIENSSTADTVPSITIASTPSPVQLTCSGNSSGGTTHNYSLTPCCGGTVLFGFSSSNSLSGIRIYQNQSYTLAASNTSGAINIDLLNSGSCPISYYSLNSCSDGSFQHHARSVCSNLNNTQLTYNGTCYSVQNSTNTTGTVNLDTLNSCTCSNPNPTYYLLRDCATVTIVRTSTTTTDLTLNVSSTLANASRVQDTNTGKCYTANSTTQDTVTYPTAIGAVTSLGVNDCPSTPCTTTQYYNLQQCSTGNTGFISAQTTDQIALSVNDMVTSGSTNGPLYKVLGNATSGNSVGTVFANAATACPAYYTLTQCYTNQTGYRTDNTTTEITLSNGRRVQGPNGMPYTVTGTVGSGLANIGTVTDTGQTGCPTITGSTQYYQLERCSDSVTGFLSLQTVNDINLSTNDVVGLGSASGVTYQVTGTGLANTGTQVGVVADTGNTNCLTPVTPPVVPGTTTYARFISCDDPTGAIISVSSTQSIGTWWVISEVGQFECYRWLDNTQGVNPIELNSSNFNFYTVESTAGANCSDCQSVVPPPAPAPRPPSQTCFTLSLLRSSTALNLCDVVPTTVYANNSTLASASIIYSNSDCTTLESVDRYLASSIGAGYYFWNASAQTLTGSFTLNCP